MFKKAQIILCVRVEMKVINILFLVIAKNYLSCRLTLTETYIGYSTTLRALLQAFYLS